jgi:hypothetical protein
MEGARLEAEREDVAYISCESGLGFISIPIQA